MQIRIDRSPSRLPRLVVTGLLTVAVSGAASDAGRASAATANGPATVEDPARRLEAEWTLTAGLLKADQSLEPRSNALLAPHSLAMLMRLVRTGASGRTAEELDRLFPPALQTAEAIGVPTAPGTGPMVKPRPTLGVQAEANGGYGLIVRKVAPALATSGPKVNDLILSANGEPTRTPADLAAVVGGLPDPAPAVKLQIYQYETGRVVTLATPTQPAPRSEPTAPAFEERRVVLHRPDVLLTPGFAHRARTEFHAGLLAVDFQRPKAAELERLGTLLPAAARSNPERLASWARADRDTQLVLLSVAEFRSPWVVPFPAAQPGEFEDADGHRHPAEFFGDTRRLLHASTTAFDLAEIPYRDADASFLLLLPRRRGPIPELTPEVTREIAGALSTLNSRTVEIQLPVFRHAGERSLGQALEALGLVAPFSGSAELSGLAGDIDLAVGAVTQAGEILLHPAGTVASVTTRVELKALGAEAEGTIRLRADHPFLFLILDRRAGTIRFAGRVETPAGLKSASQPGR